MPSQDWTLPGTPLNTRLLPNTTSYVQTLCTASSEHEVIDLAIAELRAFGATMFIAGVLPLARLGKRRLLSHSILHGWPREWSKIYMRRNLDRFDPVRRLLFAGRLSVVWHEMTEEELGDARGRAVMADAATHGLKDGYTTLLPTLDTDKILFAMAGESIRIDERGEERVGLIITHAVGAMIRLREARRLAMRIRVTDREREALQLAAQGHKNEVIGVRMTISKNGVEKLLSNARDKLDAANTVQAIGNAMRLKIIR